MVESGEVAGADGGAEGLEAVCEAVGFGAGEKGGAGEAAEDDVACDEVDQDEAALFGALFVGG